MGSQKRIKARKVTAMKRRHHKYIWPRNADGSKRCEKCGLLFTEKRRFTTPCKGSSKVEL
jgi:hypothetical protein